MCKFIFLIENKSILVLVRVHPRKLLYPRILYILGTRLLSTGSTQDQAT